MSSLRAKENPRSRRSRGFLNVLKGSIKNLKRSNPTEELQKGIQYLEKASVIVENGIAKSALDDRVYKLITLPNRLEVLLIHDKRVVLSGAALTVKGKQQ